MLESLELNISALLDAREERWRRRLALSEGTLSEGTLSEGPLSADPLSEGGALLTMTLNLPGPDKGLPRWLEFYGAVRADLQRTLRDEGFDFFHVPDVPHFFHKFGQLSAAGPEDHFLFRGLASGEELKRRAADFEERHPGGRLVDLDVMVRGEPIGREALGLPPRPCFCCPRPARECAGSARHPLNEVLEAAERILEAALSL